MKILKKLNKIFVVMMLGTLLFTNVINTLPLFNEVGYAAKATKKEKESTTNQTVDADEQSNAWSTDESAKIVMASGYDIKTQLANTFSTLIGGYGQDSASGYGDLYDSGSKASSALKTLGINITTLGLDNLKKTQTSSGGKAGQVQLNDAAQRVKPGAKQVRTNACDILLNDITTKDAQSFNTATCDFAQSLASSYTKDVVDIAGPHTGVIQSNTGGEANGITTTTQQTKGYTEIVKKSTFSKQGLSKPKNVGTNNNIVYTPASVLSPNLMYNKNNQTESQSVTNTEGRTSRVTQAIASVLYTKLQSLANNSYSLKSGSDSKSKGASKLLKDSKNAVKMDTSYQKESDSTGLKGIFTGLLGLNDSTANVDLAAVVETYNKALEFSYPGTYKSSLNGSAGKAKNQLGIIRRVSKGKISSSFYTDTAGNAGWVMSNGNPSKVAYSAIKKGSSPSDSDFENSMILGVPTSIDSKSSVANVPTEAMDSKGKKVASKVTDSNGAYKAFKKELYAYTKKKKAMTSDVKSNSSMVGWIPMYTNNNTDGYKSAVTKWYKKNYDKAFNPTLNAITPLDLVDNSKKSPVMSWETAQKAYKEGNNSKAVMNYKLGKNDGDDKTSKSAKSPASSTKNIIPLAEYLSITDGKKVGDGNNFPTAGITGKSNKVIGTKLFGYVSWGAKDFSSDKMDILGEDRSSLGMDNYGNIINGSNLKVVIPYWQNYTTQQTYNLSKNGGYASTPILFNDSVSKTKSKLDNIYSSATPNAIDANANEDDIYKKLTTGKVKLSTSGLKKDEMLKDIKLAADLLKGKQSVSGIQSAMKKSNNKQAVALGLAMIITANTKDDIKSFNKMFINRANKSKQLYVGKSDINDSGADEADDTLDKFSAADLLEKIWILLNVGVFEIIRLTISQFVINVYTGSLATSGLSSIFYTNTISNSSNYSDVLDIISKLFFVLVGILLLVWTFKFARGKLSGGKFVRNFIFTIGILLIPSFYGNVIDTIMNKPSSLIIGQQLKQTSILDMWATTKKASTENNIYAKKFYGMTDSDLDKMLKEKQKDYVVYFYTTTNKKGFNIDAITANTNLGLVDRSKANAIADKSTGATWGSNDLEKVAVSTYDLKEWVLARYANNHPDEAKAQATSDTDKDNINNTTKKEKDAEAKKVLSSDSASTNQTLFPWLASSSSNAEDYVANDKTGKKGINQYDEYHVDMTKYFNQTQKNLGFADVKSPYTNLTASNLYYDIFETLTSSSNGADSVFNSLSKLSGLLDDSKMNGSNKFSQAEIDIFISDISRTRKARAVLYSANDISKSLSNNAQALALFNSSKDAGKSSTVTTQNLFSPVSYKIMSAIGMTPPTTDAFGLEKITHSLAPYEALGDLTTDGKVYEVNKKLLKQYLSTYATVRRTANGVDSVFDDSERVAMSLQALFTIDDYFHIGLFPTNYEPNSINFDSFVRMVYMPMADFNSKDPYKQNVATYVTTAYGTLDIILFLIAILCLVVFGLIYLLLFSGAMMILSLATYIYNFVIKDDNDDERKANIFGNLYIYGGFALAKAGLFALFWIMNIWLNKSIADNGGSTFPHVIIFSLMIIAYTALCMWKVFIPLFKHVSKDFSTLGGNAAMQATDKAKNATMSKLAKTALGTAVGLGTLGLATRAGRRNAGRAYNGVKGGLGKGKRAVDKIKNATGVRGKVLMNSRLGKAIQRKGNELSGGVLFSNKEHQTLSQKLKDRGTNLRHGAMSKLAGATRKTLGKTTSAVVTGVLGAERVQNYKDRNFGGISEGNDKVQKIFSNDNDEAVGYIGKDAKAGVKRFKWNTDDEHDELKKMLNKGNVRILREDKANKTFIIADTLGLGNEAMRAVSFGDYVSTEVPTNLKVQERRGLTPSLDITNYSTLSDGSYKFALATDGSDRAVNAISDKEMWRLINEDSDKFNEYFDLPDDIERRIRGDKVTGSSINLKLKEGKDFNKAMDWLNGKHEGLYNANRDENLAISAKRAPNGGQIIMNGVSSEQLQGLIKKANIAPEQYGVMVQGNTLRYADEDGFNHAREFKDIIQSTATKQAKVHNTMAASVAKFISTGEGLDFGDATNKDIADADSVKYADWRRKEEDLIKQDELLDAKTKKAKIDAILPKDEWLSKGNGVKDMKLERGGAVIADIKGKTKQGFHAIGAVANVLGTNSVAKTDLGGYIKAKDEAIRNLRSARKGDATYDGAKSVLADVLMGDSSTKARDLVINADNNDNFNEEAVDYLKANNKSALSTALSRAKDTNALSPNIKDKLVTAERNLDDDIKDDDILKQHRSALKSLSGDSLETLNKLSSTHATIKLGKDSVAVSADGSKGFELNDSSKQKQLFKSMTDVAKIFG